MALVTCTECGKEISNSANSCPYCGCKTRAGILESQTKGIIAGMLVAMILTVVGVILAVSAYLTLIDYGVDSIERLMRWISYDSENFMVFMKLCVGLGMQVGGIIALVNCNRRAKELRYYSPSSPSKSESYTITSHPKAYEDKIPTWKRIQMEENGER